MNPSNKSRGVGNTDKFMGIPQCLTTRRSSSKNSQLFYYGGQAAIRSGLNDAFIRILLKSPPIFLLYGKYWARVFHSDTAG